MTYIKEMWVLKHLDWYTVEKGVGYVPTKEAPPEAVVAIEALNEAIKKRASVK